MSLDTSLLQILDRMGCGGLVVAADGTVIAGNDMARVILQSNLAGDGEDFIDLDNAGRELVKHLLRQGRTRISLDQENWILVERENRRPLIMNAMAGSDSGADGHSILVLIDLDAGLKPNQQALEKIFGLTPAEAKLATLIAGGATTSEAAQILAVSVATVRSQLAAAFAKTRTRRQAELVTLVSRLSALP